MAKKAKQKALRFGKRSRVALGNRRCQAMEMVIDPGKPRAGLIIVIAERINDCSL